MEWISVDKEMPEESLPVWVLTKDKDIKIMCLSFLEYNYVWSNIYEIPSYFKGKWICTNGYFDDQENVTHWINLPEPIL